MKKLFLSITLLLLAATSLFAVRAKQGICQLQLVDGTIVSATLHGDENFHYYTLLDGTPLRESTNGKYQMTSQEELENEFSAVQARMQQATTATFGASRASSIGSILPAYFPHKGSPKALVILVQFQDVKFKSSDPVATFNHYLNGKAGEAMPKADKSIFSQKEEHLNYGSVKQYFTDMSHGQFTPQFDIVGPVTVSKNSAYYGGNGSARDGADLHFVDMMTEACQLMDNNIDFADYDSNGDKYVDLVYFIYAGYSESISGNSSDCLWPKSGTASIGTFDDVHVSRFGINNELNGTPKDKSIKINGIGLFCHEFSHTLGLPDLYPTDKYNLSATANNQSPEYWDLMDMGCYQQNGYCPIPYSPWEKSMMEWVQPTTLYNTEPQQITLKPYDIASEALKIKAETDGEYLLLQNIRNEKWYKEAFGYGMLVWRIDYADKAYVRLGDNPNDTVGKPRVMIVPADGLVINSANVRDNGTYTYDVYTLSLENDPFPMYKKGSATEYEVNSLTSVQLNHSTLTTRPLYNIVKDEETGMVTFDYLKDFSATGIQEAIIDKSQSKPTAYFTLEGVRVLTPQKGHLYITNKGKKIIF